MNSTKEDDQKKGRGKGTGTDLPTISSKRMKKIIRTFFSVNAADNAVSSSEVAKIAGMNRTDVSKQMRFLLSIGLINKVGREYKLTSKGADYAKFLSWDQEEDATMLLRELLLISKDIERFNKSLKVQERDLSKDEAVKLYGTIAGIPPSRPDLVMGMNSVIDLMIESGLVNASEEGYISVSTDEDLSLEPSKEEIDITLDKVRTWKQKQEELFPSIEPQDFVINLNINLNLSEQTDPESVKNIIKAIKEGLRDESNQSNEDLRSEEDQ